MNDSVVGNERKKKHNILMRMRRRSFREFVRGPEVKMFRRKSRFRPGAVDPGLYVPSR
jgi:hypothetical protein